MSNADALRSLPQLARVYDEIPAWLGDFVHAGRAEDPRFLELQALFNRVGSPLVRMRDAVATAIAIGNTSDPTWRGIVRELPGVVYNTSEQLAGVSGLPRFTDAEVASVIDGVPSGRIVPTMASTFATWTSPEIVAIVPTLPANFETWTAETQRVLMRCVFLINQLAGSASGGGTAAGVAPGTTTGIHHVRPVIDGSAAKLGIASVFGLVLWFIFKPHKRRRSA